jgi:hypothetical protein
VEWARALGRRLAGDDEDGFTVVEASVSFGVVLLALAGLLATMGLGTRAGTESRTRAAAIDLAQAEVERAESGPLGRVGLGVADATLAADPDVSAGVVTLTGEPVVTVADPLWATHTWTAHAEGDDVVLRVLVTDLPPALCTSCVRVVVRASWTSHLGGSGRVELTALVGPTATSVVVP